MPAAGTGRCGCPWGSLAYIPGVGETQWGEASSSSRCSHWARRTGPGQRELLLTGKVSDCPAGGDMAASSWGDAGHGGGSAPEQPGTPSPGRAWLMEPGREQAYRGNRSIPASPEPLHSEAPRGRTEKAPAPFPTCRDEL